jgi:hypothetical protein
MNGRMEIDTTRVAALARTLADTAEDLYSSTRIVADLPPLRQSTAAWIDAADRHDAGVHAVVDVLTALADHTAGVADTLVGAVGITAAQDLRTARSIAGAPGEQR